VVTICPVLTIIETSLPVAVEIKSLA
jgi:hypothetical protein